MLLGKRIIALCTAMIHNERNIDFISVFHPLLCENNYQIIIYNCCTDFYENNITDVAEESVYKLIDYSITDAVVVFDESFHDKSVPQNIVKDALANNVPVLCLGNRYDGCTNFIFDYEKGFEDIVRHVITEHGARDICMIAGVEGEATSEGRIAAFRRVMSEYDLTIHENRLYYGDYWWKPTKIALEDMMAKGPLPDAIVCANDMMAVTVCEELRNLGYKIPDDVIVTGFDGTQEAMNNTPVLSTCKCDLELTSRKMIEALKLIFDGGTPEEMNYIPYVTDIYRSCGCNRMPKEVNKGDLLKQSQDIINKYQNDNRQLHAITEDIMLHSSPAEFAERLSTFNFYGVSIIVNNDCFAADINPTEHRRAVPFDDTMQVLYEPFSDLPQFPSPMARKDILPKLPVVMEYQHTLVINALTALGQPMGYMCFYCPPHPATYCIIPQYVTAMNNAIINFRSVRYLKFVAESMKNISKHDFMTGMYNRTGFYDDMPLLVEFASPNDNILVATIDIDGLKMINDQYGHEEGDFTIKTVCDAVKALPFPRLVCGRFGGDEIVVCALSDDPDAADIMKKSLADSISAVNRISGKAFDVSASIGICTSPKKGFDFEKALKISDEAMYIMKIGRPNRRKS